ncbi:hypothetical protein Franean1_4761 [Parafrankia sp. EAN1pec]|uniref:hypothetical protein n=1 Tax=Parafrankia sp. (strain EAN1pec) TaxID=298653 RepID=UPI00005451EE|nr:hypothetical protein Franean1_4761 [Frankia sp. EAN1pec]
MTTDNSAAVDDGLPERLANFRPVYEALPPADRPAHVARWTALIDAARQRSAAALRLQAWFGSADERQWAGDPNGPRLSAQELMAATRGAAMPYRGPDDDRPRPTAADLADALRQIDQARLDLAQLEERLVELARTEADDRRRLPWTEIADALGLASPQTAQQRYRHSSRLHADTDAALTGGEAGRDE